MNKPWLKFYAQDFLIGTDLMSSDEVGLYIRLLSYQWVLPEHSLSSDQNELIRLSRWEGASIPPRVLAKFENRNGRLVNPRLEQERMKVAEYSTVQSANAKARWSGNGHPKPVATVPTAEIPKPDPFDLFWKLYPNRKGKEDARRAFAKALKKTTVEAILAAVAEQIGWEDWTKDNGQFIPHPATWLNRGGWQDEPKPGPDPDISPVTGMRYADFPVQPGEDDPFKSVREDCQ